VPELAFDPRAERAELRRSSWAEMVLRSRSSWLSNDLRLVMRGIVLRAGYWAFGCLQRNQRQLRPTSRMFVYYYSDILLRYSTVARIGRLALASAMTIRVFGLLCFGRGLANSDQPRSGFAPSRWICTYRSRSNHEFSSGLLHRNLTQLMKRKWGMGSKTPWRTCLRTQVSGKNHRHAVRRSL